MGHANDSASGIIRLRRGHPVTDYAAMRWQRLLGAAGAVALLGGCEMAKSPARAPAQAGAPAAPRPARELWLGYCASCHGIDGAGSPVAMLRFDAAWRTTRPDSLIRARIVGGVPGTTMGPWGMQLSAAEIDALVGYVKALASP